MLNHKVERCHFVAMPQLIALFIFAVLSSTSAYATDDAVVITADPSIEKTTMRFQATFETLTLPGSEKMGYLGSNLLFDMRSWYSLGFASYGALTGNRGGFIATGFTADVRQHVSTNFEINSNLFVGAGGGRGGYLLSGGGLMLRYGLGIKYSSKLGDIGVGYSYVDFPNGYIHTSQSYMSYEYQFPITIGDGWINSPNEQQYPLADEHIVEQEISMILNSYRVPSGVMQDNGVRPQSPIINTIGINWSRYLDENDRFFLNFLTEGAMGGKSHGFMTILFGGGYRIPLFDHTHIKLISSIGVAGGGAVATGEGLLLHESVGIQQALGSNIYLEFDMGYIFSPGNSFQATSYTGKLGFDYLSPNFDGSALLSELSYFDFKKIRARVAQQTYVKAAPNWRSRDKDLNVQLLGIQFDWFLNPYLFLTGQTMAAYKGKAGAYMMGLLGAGIHIPIMNDLLYAEIEGGAGPAGGGSLDVNGGFIWQASGTLGLKMSDSFSVFASYGYLTAPKGQFRAKVTTLGVGYHFTLFSR